MVVMSGGLVADRYRLVSRLGNGAMGQVWRALDERLRRDVAIKLVDLAAAGDAATAERFQREAVAAARLNHRNIVTVFDTGRDGSTAFLVMELLRGRSLAEAIRADGPLPVGEAARIGGEVAAALEATHAIGLVHRDIKPANIMVDGPSVKLLDFGIAQLAGDAAHLTAPATAIGTAAFMSPEQAMGYRAGPASDIYSLGCVLVTALTGQPPFPGDNAIQVASRQISEPAPRVRSRRPEAPPALDDLVARMLAKDPAGRPSAAEVRGVLTAPFASAPVGPPATAVMPSGAAAATVPMASGAAPVGSASRPSPQEPVWTPPPDDRGYRRAAKWIALVIAGLLVVGIVWALGSNLVNGLLNPAAAPAPSRTPTPTRTTPTATPTSTPPRATLPSLPSLPQLPTMPTLPTLPTQLQASVGAVDAAINAIDDRPEGAAKAKAKLQAAWATASKQILAGQNGQKALTTFSGKLEDARDSIGGLEYLTISAALKAVGASL